MNRPKKVDANQPAITEELRKYEISVQTIHTIGKGVPDILVGVAGWNFLYELKVNNKEKLTDDELKWQANWTGQVETKVKVIEILNDIIKRLRNIQTFIAQDEVKRLDKIIENLKGAEANESPANDNFRRTERSGKIYNRSEVSRSIK